MLLFAVRIGCLHRMDLRWDYLDYKVDLRVYHGTRLIRDKQSTPFQVRTPYEEHITDFIVASIERFDKCAKTMFDFKSKFENIYKMYDRLIFLNLIFVLFYCSWRKPYCTVKSTVVLVPYGLRS